MKNYFIDLWKRIINASIIKKVFICLSVLIYIFILIICFKKVEVVLLTPGNLNSPAAGIEIENASDTDINYIGTIGVFEYKRISLIQYWLSKNDNRFTLSEIDNTLDLTQKEDLKQGMILKDNSIINALIAAYTKASKDNPDVTINSGNIIKGVMVIGIYSYANTDLKLGDLICEINDYKFSSYKEFLELYSKIKNESDYISFTIKNGDKSEKRTAKFTTRDGEKVIGLALDVALNAPETTPKYNIKSDYSSIGSSGGAMTALSIYDRLTSGDITHGKKVVGTGTIDADGNIGIIGGVKQKIITAKNYGIDIFFVAEANYEEAIKAYKEFECSFELIKVSHFDEIVDYLKGLER